MDFVLVLVGDTSTAVGGSCNDRADDDDADAAADRGPGDSC